MNQMGLRLYWFALAVLGVWRVTHLLNAEDGPWNLLARLRRRVGSGWRGSFLDCFYCLSLWIAIPPAYYLGAQWKERLLLWPALSGGVILLERITSPERHTPAAAYTENEEGEDVLRQQQDTISTRNFD
jgi:hypothetical protein